jgi:hypothetical protein
VQLAGIEQEDVIVNPRWVWRHFEQERRGGEPGAAMRARFPPPSLSMKKQNPSLQLFRRQEELIGSAVAGAS